MSSWCTIESDPGVFTELMQQMGVQDVQMEEVYVLDKASLAQLAPVHGLIFLFKWVSDPEPRATISPPPEGVFFASQVVNNACATQAILSVLLNKTDDIDVGTTLGTFKEFTASFPPDMKGLAISNSDDIRTAHNAFARPEPFVMESHKANEDDDVYHFVAYVPVNGVLYELDGLQAGPIKHAEVGPGDAWLDAAIPVIQQRMQRYSGSEIRFNLMAITRNRVSVLSEALAEHRSRAAWLGRRMVALGTSEDVVGDTTAATGTEPMDVAGETDVDMLAARRAAEEDEASAVERAIAQQRARYEAWRQENIRRRHNYVPFVVNLLKVLAEKQQLPGLLAAAKEAHAAKQAAQPK